MKESEKPQEDGAAEIDPKDPHSGHHALREVQQIDPRDPGGGHTAHTDDEDDDEDGS